MTAGLASKLLTLEQWCIGYARMGIAEFLEAPGRAHVQWLKPPHRAALLADPFGVEENGRLTIYAEQLTYGRTKGQIVRITPGRGDSEPVLMLKRPFHLSYPFVLEDHGRRYVTPEQGESGFLAFYPLGSEGFGAPVAVVQGLDAVDPTFFRHNGFWWLFCTRRSMGANEALYLYFAERPLGPYRPHPRNPVVVGAECARPAGRLIRIGSRVLRPAQNCSASYGGSITLCEIDRLDPDHYQEHAVQHLLPGDVEGGYSDGLHTLDHTEHFVLIDTKRMAFAPLAAPIKLADKLISRA